MGGPGPRVTVMTSSVLLASTGDADSAVSMFTVCSTTGKLGLQDVAR